MGFGDSRAAREWARNRTQRAKAAKAQVQAEKRMSEVETLDYMPAPEPEDTAPLQTDVVRGSFGERKRVAGSDVVVDEEDESVAEKYSWDSMVRGNFDQWKKRQL